MSDPILEHCDPFFAEAWSRADQALVLSGGFIDAACIAGYRDQSESLRVYLGRAGFNRYFGELLEGVSDNLFALATRHVRRNLEQACKDAVAGNNPPRFEVTWRIDHPGEGGAECDDALKTAVSVQRVGESGEEHLLYFVLSDVTNRRKLEHSLSRSQYVSSLSAMFIEAFIYDLGTGSTEVLFGSSENAEKGKREIGFHAYSKRMHPDDRKMFWSHTNARSLRKNLFGNDAQSLVVFDARRMETDDTYHWVSFSITRVDNLEKDAKVLVCVRSLDEKMESQRRERDLRSKAQTDALTGLYNRGATEELITAALSSRQGQETNYLIVFDVDRFKAVNDTYGHLVGDELLKCVALSIKEMCREGDVAGRIGGDEFVVYASDGCASSLENVGGRVDECLRRMESFSLEREIDPPITLSAGIVPVGAGISSYAEAFARADTLLYQAKEDGRNGYRLYQP